jgi:peptidoglycan L-alanyl-D-glutamate endopeptidase CwlK
MPLDSASELKLAQVHPILAQRVHAAQDALESLGIFFRVAEGLRTYAEQDALYAKGRTVPGSIVTNARGGFSNHNFGMAVDCFPFVHGSTGALEMANSKAPNFIAMVAALKNQGLVWGGSWVHMPDAPHFQLPTVPVTPTIVDRAAFAHGGLPSVWALYPGIK